MSHGTQTRLEDGNPFEPSLFACPAPVETACKKQESCRFEKRPEFRLFSKLYETLLKILGLFFQAIGLQAVERVLDLDPARISSRRQASQGSIQEETHRCARRIPLTPTHGAFLPGYHPISLFLWTLRDEFSSTAAVHRFWSWNGFLITCFD